MRADGGSGSMAVPGGVAPRKKTYVELAVEGLEARVQSLQEALSILEGTLGPLLAEGDHNTVVQAPETTTEVVNDISKLCGALYSIEDRIRALNGRLG